MKGSLDIAEFVQEKAKNYQGDVSKELIRCWCYYEAGRACLPMWIAALAYYRITKEEGLSSLHKADYPSD